jgi:nucleoside-diphosphate-sugar epimerase
LPEGVRAVRVADITDRESVGSTLAGVDTIIHLAAHVHHAGVKNAAVSAEFERVNCLGTKTVLEEAVRASVGHIVFVSSVKALGNRSDRPFAEVDVPHPEDPYGATKRRAELILEEAASSGAIGVTIVRIPLVYGPGMRANMLRMFVAVSRRLPLPFGGVKNQRSLVYVGNAVAALRAVAAPTVGFRLFHVTDGTDLSTPGLLRAIGKAMGKPARLVHAPEWLLLSLGRIGDVLGSTTSLPGSDDLTKLLSSLQLDSSRINRELGFVPPLTVEEGLASTAEWFRDRQMGFNRPGGGRSCT